MLTLQRGFDITRAEQRAGSIPVVSSGGIGSYHDTAAARGPGVVIGRKGTLGKTFYLPGDYWPHDTTLWVKDFKGSLPRFTYYFFKQLNVMGLDVGSANPTLNRNHVHPLPVVWPSRRLQEAIAAVLGALDDKIAVNEQIVESVHELCSAQFCSSFREALAHVLNERPLPEGWRQAKFGQQVSVLETGGRPRGGVAGYASGVPSIGAESISQLAKFDFGKVKFVPEEFFAGLKRGVVQSHDILLYKDGGRPGNFQPHVSMFGNGFPFSRSAINEHVYRIRMMSPLSQHFGYFWLNSAPLREEMRSRGTGVAIPGLNSSSVKDLPIVIPPAGRLREFDRLASPLVDRALAAASESHLMAQLRDLLLPELVSGKVQVRDAERVVEDAT
ncbi:restriction endonuclease subunit S [Micromonospora sp. NPDC048868]|uniref:restriction endonuclease subunit S n=1 Tax=Micromonospora sp. NPDC048868 TaxID=3364258 RepID=UPI00371B24BA